MPSTPYNYPFSSGPFATTSPQLAPRNKYRNIQQQHFVDPRQNSTRFTHNRSRRLPGRGGYSPANLHPASPGGENNAIYAALAKGPDSLRSTSTPSSLSSPYFDGGRMQNGTITSKFSLPADPHTWGSAISGLEYEDDDDLHDPYRKRKRFPYGGSGISFRGLMNVGCVILLMTTLLGLFAGYPIAFHFTRPKQRSFGGFNIGGINSTGQVPGIPGNWGLIDMDTPQSARSIKSYVDGSEMQLVFSDEFNTDGRSFYPGDDPYWEAADLHYWQTNNLEWYDPGAVRTKDGSLQITLSQKRTHNLNYEGGMLTTWNKFCFTGGLIQTSAMLPGVNNIVGLWPAVWTMGNLGRAGYGASLEGMWPYTYDGCDVGTAPNQTHNGLPLAATVNGDENEGGALSFLPGQKLSRCTCPGESHPGPLHNDGTFVGRAAPEIDVFEAQVTGEPLTGQVSQSAQWAPFNAGYEWFNTSANLEIANPSISMQNTYIGGAFQQATSVITETDAGCYESEGRCFSVYGFEYKPGFEDAYITWISTGKVSWTLRAPGMAADTRAEISARPVPQEPMYIIANLGMSTNFGDVDIQHLTFPATLRIDWIRVYQHPGLINIGCDPKDFPTADYIAQHNSAYTDSNLTTWRGDYKQPFPKNRFLGQC